MFMRLVGVAIIMLAAAAMQPPPSNTGAAAHASSLKPLKTIALGDVAGRIDHMSLDSAGQRLYIAALGNGSIEVIDLAAGKSAGRIGDLPEPQGVAYLPASKQVVVACGGDGTCRLYDAASLKEVARVQAGGDADNVRVDAKTGRIYVGADPGLAILEAGAGTLIKRGEIALAGHAESLQLETNGPRIFVNVPEAKQVQVVDREKKIVAPSWNIADARSNFPMALDEANHRLLVACRSPAKLLVIDTETGKTLASMECAGDADEVFLDPAHHRALVVGGEGFVDVFTMQGDAGQWKRERVATARGARTGLFDAANQTLYVAVPKRGEQSAEIRVFKFEDGS